MTFKWIIIKFPLSATWPESVRRMAKNYTKNPIMVVIGTVELRAVQSVKQNIVILDENEKYDWVSYYLCGVKE